MFCEQCGSQIDDGQRFCQKCLNIQSHDNNISSETSIVLRIGSIVYVIISSTIFFVILYSIYSKFILRLIPKNQDWSFIIIFLISVVSSVLSCKFLFKKIRDKIKNKKQ